MNNYMVRVQDRYCIATQYKWFGPMSDDAAGALCAELAKEPYVYEALVKTVAEFNAPAAVEAAGCEGQ